MYAVTIWKAKVVETDNLKKEAKALCLEIGSSTIPIVMSHKCPVKAMAASLLFPDVTPAAFPLSLK